MALDIRDAPSPHRNPRPTPTIDCIVIHDTESETARAALSWFEAPQSKVSAHYVIDRDGALYRCVPDADRAWHAGRSVLGGRDNVNDVSIGIELVGFATRPYPDAQIDALVALCVDLCARYPAITLDRIVGHEHIAVPAGRKTDPGPHFPWETFRARIQLELMHLVAWAGQAADETAGGRKGPDATPRPAGAVRAVALPAPAILAEASEGAVEAPAEGTLQMGLYRSLTTGRDRRV